MFLDNARDRKIGKTGLTFIGVGVAVLIIGGGVGAKAAIEYKNQAEAVTQLEAPYPQFHATAKALDKQVADHDKLFAQPVFASSEWKAYVSKQSTDAIKPSTDVVDAIDDLRESVKYAGLKERLDTLKKHYSTEITGETVLKARAIGVVTRACNGDPVAGESTTLNKRIAEAGITTTCPSVNTASTGK